MVTYWKGGSQTSSDLLQQRTGTGRGEDYSQSTKYREAINDRSVTLYDITAIAYLKTLFVNKRQYAVGKIQIPSIPRSVVARDMSGNNMYPILKSGDVAGYKEMNICR